MGRGLGVSAGLGVGEGLGVELGVAVGVAVAVAVGVAVGVGVGPDCAQYLPPVFQTVDIISSAPDDHFAASLDCRVNVSGAWRSGGASRYPAVHAGIVSAAGVYGVAAPDDHFTTSPDRRVPVSAGGRVGSAGRHPTVGAGIVSPPGVQIAAVNSPPQTIISLPVQTALCRCRLEGAPGVLVVAQLSVPGLYLPPVLAIGVAAPDDHFTAGPHCRVKVSAGGRAGGAGGGPTICDGVVSAHRCLKRCRRSPPQTIISLPVQTAV